MKRNQTPTGAVATQSGVPDLYERRVSADLDTAIE
jgi:hypothetical protein